MAYTGPFLDRVSETVTTTGTGSVTTSSNAANSLANWASVATTGGQYYYLLTSGNGTDWEVGLATVTISGSAATLTRTNITASSNSGSAISLSGTSTISSDVPAGYLNGLQPLLNLAPPGGNKTGLYYRPTLLTVKGAGATPSGISTTVMYAQSFIIGAGSATLKSITVYMSGAPTTSYNWEGGVYTDSGNYTPANLISGTDTGSVATGTTLGNSTYTFPTPVTLPALPGIYWVALKWQTGGANGQVWTTTGGTGGDLEGALIGTGSISYYTGSTQFGGFQTNAPGTFGTMPATFTNGGTLSGSLTFNAIPYLGF